LKPRENKADEALILNPDGTLSETNTANILVLSDRMAIRPVSPHVLPGVMQDSVCQRLVEMGFTIVDRALRFDGKLDGMSILLTNALMGVVPAVSLDGRHLQVDRELVTSLNNILFCAGDSPPNTSKSTSFS
jgi:para-aminobenzoate synthetase component 1